MKLTAFTKTSSLGKFTNSQAGGEGVSHNFADVKLFTRQYNRSIYTPAYLLNLTCGRVTTSVPLVFCAPVVAGVTGKIRAALTVSATWSTVRRLIQGIRPYKGECVRPSG